MDHVTHSRARAYLLTRRRVAGEAAFSLDTTTTLGSWCLCTLLHIPTLTILKARSSSGPQAQCLTLERSRHAPAPRARNAPNKNPRFHPRPHRSKKSKEERETKRRRQAMATSTAGLRITA
jgi:hypothetical protein